VTHIVWETKASHGNDTIAADFAFFRFLEASAVDRREIGGFTIAKMIAPVNAPSGNEVLLIDCSDPARNGELTLERVTPKAGGWNPDALPEVRPVTGIDEAAHRAELLLVRAPGRGCYTPSAADGWVDVARRKGDALWIKKRDPLSVDPTCPVLQTAGTGTGTGR
jgi:hypothetical protein